MSEAADGTGKGLMAFLDRTGERGEINRSTARSIRVACGKVLAVEGDPGSVDIRNLDAEEIFSRFETLNRLNYSTESMKVYRSRFLNGIAMYRARLDGRSDWKTAGGWNRRGSGEGRKSAKEGGKAARAKAPRQQDPAAAAPDAPAAGNPPAGPADGAPALVPYELPLRRGLRVRLALPEDLTQADAERISAFVGSLAFSQDEISAKGAGDAD